METLTLTQAQSRSISNYRRMGIDIDVLDDDTVKITQSRLLNGYLLNQKELVERAKEIFPDAKVVPVVHSLDVDMINLDWITGKMDEFGIKRNDLIKQLAIDKSSLSSILSGDRGLSKGQKAAFFFYFLTYELNRDLRKMLVAEEFETVDGEIRLSLLKKLDIAKPLDVIVLSKSEAESYSDIQRLANDRINHRHMYAKYDDKERKLKFFEK